MSGSLSLVYPVMAQVLLTMIMIVWTGQVRTRALRQGRLRVRDIALDGQAWPDDVKKVSNNMHNQFETPLLFYVLCGVATYLGATGLLMTLLAWAYVATRIVHTAVHVTTNRVRHRFLVFSLGFAVLLVMWVALATRLLAA